MCKGRTYAKKERKDARVLLSILSAGPGRGPLQGRPGAVTGRKPVFTALGIPSAVSSQSCGLGQVTPSCEPGFPSGRTLEGTQQRLGHWGLNNHNQTPLVMELVMGSQGGLASLQPAQTPTREGPLRWGMRPRKKSFPNGCASASGQTWGPKNPQLGRSLGELCWGLSPHLSPRLCQCVEIVHLPVKAGWLGSGSQGTWKWGPTGPVPAAGG